jgi:excisionase family DNA binding protein
MRTSVGKVRVVDEEVLMTQDEVAEYLAVRLGTVLAWRARHIGPRGYRVGKHVRYRRSDVDHWLEQRADKPREGGDASETHEPADTRRRT